MVNDRRRVESRVRGHDGALPVQPRMPRAVTRWAVGWTALEPKPSQRSIPETRGQYPGYSILRILKLIEPFGTLTSTVSPTFLPTRPLPMGLLIRYLPLS